MRGRHQLAPVRRAPLRVLAGAAGASVAAAMVMAFFPASASADSTVDAQLSLTGVATSANVLGGSQIGIHPGDSVNFKASAAPTAGLENIPALGSLLDGLLGTLGSRLYQVEVSFPAAFPGGAQKVTLGGPKTGDCAGLPAKTVRFPVKGTYNFTWTVKYIAVGLLGSCTEKSLTSTEVNQLKNAGVALNASNSWVGKIVVADNPPGGGISIQLPGVSVAPSVAGHQLPTITVPGVNVPTVPVTIPSLGLPTTPAGGSAGGGHGTTPGGGAGSPIDELPVPARVVPRGQGDAVFGNVGGVGFPGVLPGTTNADGSSTLVPAASAATKSAAAGIEQDSTGKHKTIDLAADKAESTGQFSVILAIIAIVALSVVAATYARLYLLRREG